MLVALILRSVVQIFVTCIYISSIGEDTCKLCAFGENTHTEGQNSMGKFTITNLVKSQSPCFVAKNDNLPFVW
jgi:hypothetical protein